MGSKRVGADAAPPLIDLSSSPPHTPAWVVMRERMALNWRLPPDELDAALLLGLPHAAPPDDLAPAVRDKAAAAAAWAETYLRGDPSDYLLLRRRLFRAVYCDWP
ncbi:MAG TPA: hypothetical protein PKE20_11190, partial [Promineifilum sp.]|nr:hypothetical protein [Promineifilum sp.]